MHILSTILFWTAVLTLAARIDAPAKGGNPPAHLDTMPAAEFKGITFLSSRCNGTCPDISMVIHPDKRIEVSRAFYVSKNKHAIRSTFEGVALAA